jgi:hypothetical protein
MHPPLSRWPAARQHRVRGSLDDRRARSSRTALGRPPRPARTGASTFERARPAAVIRALAIATSFRQPQPLAMKRPLQHLRRTLQNGRTSGGGPAQLPANDGTENDVLQEEGSDLGAYGTD